jgi:hypothetical protein
MEKKGAEISLDLAPFKEKIPLKKPCHLSIKLRSISETRVVVRIRKKSEITHLVSLIR